MFGLADRGNKNKLNSVWVKFWYYWQNLHGCDRHNPMKNENASEKTEIETLTGLKDQGQH